VYKYIAFIAWIERQTKRKLVNTLFVRYKNEII